MRVWFTVRITHTLCLKRIKKNEVQRARKAETTKVQFSAAGETCIFWPIPGFKDTTFQQLWVFSKWTSLSVSICNVSGCSDTITYSTPSLTTHRYWQCYIEEKLWKLTSTDAWGVWIPLGRCRGLAGVGCCCPHPRWWLRNPHPGTGSPWWWFPTAPHQKTCRSDSFLGHMLLLFLSFCLFVCLFYKFWMNRYMFSKNQVSGQVLMLMLCLLLSVLW